MRALLHTCIAHKRHDGYVPESSSPFPYDWIRDCPLPQVAIFQAETVKIKKGRVAMSDIIRGEPEDQPEQNPPESQQQPVRPVKMSRLDNIDFRLRKLETDFDTHINPQKATAKQESEQPKKKWTTRRILVTAILMIIVAWLFYNGYLIVAKGYTL